jgi:hypothetical protein
MIYTRNNFGTKLLNSLAKVPRRSSIAISGTPFVRDIHSSMKALLGFLKVYPYCRPTKVGKGSTATLSVSAYKQSIETGMESGDDSTECVVRTIAICKALMFRTPDNRAALLGRELRYKHHEATACGSELYLLAKAHELVRTSIGAGFAEIKSNSEIKKRCLLESAKDELLKLSASYLIVSPKCFEEIVCRDYSQSLDGQAKAKANSTAEEGARFGETAIECMYEASLTTSEFDQSRITHAAFKKTISAFGKRATVDSINKYIDAKDDGQASVDVGEEVGFEDLECVVCHRVPLYLVITKKCGHNYCTTCWEKLYSKSQRKYDRFKCPRGSLECGFCMAFTSGHRIIMPLPLSDDAELDAPEISNLVLSKITDGQPPLVSTATLNWEPSGMHAEPGAISIDTTFEVKLRVQKGVQSLAAHELETTLPPNTTTASCEGKLLPITKDIVVTSSTGMREIRKDVAAPSQDSEGSEAAAAASFAGGRADQSLERADGSTNGCSTPMEVPVRKLTIPAIEQITHFRARVAAPLSDESTHRLEENKGYVFTQFGMLASFIRVSSDSSAHGASALELSVLTPGRSGNLFDRQEVQQFCDATRHMPVYAECRKHKLPSLQFVSQTAAGKHFGVDADTISKMVRNRSALHAPAGVEWVFALTPSKGDYTKITSEQDAHTLAGSGTVGGVSDWFSYLPDAVTAPVQGDSILFYASHLRDLRPCMSQFWKDSAAVTTNPDHVFSTRFAIGRLAAITWPELHIKQVARLYKAGDLFSCIFSTFRFPFILVPLSPFRASNFTTQLVVA